MPARCVGCRVGDRRADVELKDHGADERDGCGEMQHARGDQHVDQPVLQSRAARGVPCVTY
jgi:hypothetical protein